MDNSKKSTPSSSTHIFQENHGDANPSFLPEQHPNPITSPSSFNAPSFMHTQTFPVTPQGAQHPHLISTPPSFSAPNLMHNPIFPVTPQGAQHPHLISSPPSFNAPSFMYNQTFPVTPQGAQHPHLISTPPSFNAPNIMHNPIFPAPVTIQGAQHPNPVTIQGAPHPNPVTIQGAQHPNPVAIQGAQHPNPVTFQGVQHPNLMSSPSSINVPNLMHNPTFHDPVIPEGARYSFSSDGYIVSNTGGLNEMNQPFQGETFVLEIPNGYDVISCVKQFAERFQLSLSVLCGDGLISEVDFTYPLSRTTRRSISGCYQIILFSGTYSFLNTGSGMSDFTVELADAQGTYSVGGLVASTMKAASIVKLLITNNIV